MNVRPEQKQHHEAYETVLIYMRILVCQMFFSNILLMVRFILHV